MQKCSITLGSNGLIVKTPYDPSFVPALKSAIPASDRKFDPISKAWIVLPAHASVVQGLIQAYFGEFILAPQMVTQIRKETRLLEVRYIGQCKTREDGSSTAFAWIEKEWKGIFSETVLRDWFETGPAPVQAPDQAATLYAILGVAKTASMEEIKSGFRKMARTWHPDVCKEPNAHEMFIRIKEAADLLSNPIKRGKYDAGLALQSTVKSKVDTQYLQGYSAAYRSPLRCGWVLAEGTDSLGRFVVSKIFEWTDIVQGNKTLVVSWPMGATMPMEEWV